MLRQRRGRPLGTTYSDVMRNAFRGKSGQVRRRRFFEEICGGVPPAQEHYLVAHLMEYGAIKLLLTTNFDHLIEAAVQHYCSAVVRVFLYDDDIEVADLSATPAAIVKLHGDFLFEDLANLDRETRERVTDGMRFKIRSVLEGRGLVVLGYGGRDVSIMGLLREMLVDPCGLSGGLWWVGRSRQEIAENPYLHELAAVAAQHNKRIAFLVEAGGAKMFLRRVCAGVRLESPKSQPFTIRARSNPVAAYMERFAVPRQRVPDGDVPGEALGKYEAALEQSGCIWVVGEPAAGKSRLIGSYARTLKSVPVFYYSYRFARNAPLTGNLVKNLESFAEASGVIAGGLEIKHVLQRLFEMGAVLIFDDVPPLRPGLETAFYSILRFTMIAQAQSGRGKVIVVSNHVDALSPIEWRDPTLGEILYKRLECRTLRLTDVGRAYETAARIASVANADSTATNLKNLALLRFAEHKRILTRVLGSESPAQLDRLEGDGILDRRGDWFAIREHCREQIHDLCAISQKDKAVLAERLEEVSRSVPPLLAIHLRFEAVALYFAAGEWARAAKLDVSLLSQMLEARTGPVFNVEQGAYTDLLDYFLHWDSVKDALINGLERHTLAELLATFSRAIRATGEYGATPLLWKSVRDVCATLDEAGRASLLGRMAVAWGDLEESLIRFKEAGKHLEGSSNSEERARNWLALGWSLLERAERTGNRTDVKAALRCNRKAASLFRKSKKSDEADLARENMATSLLKLGMHRRALAIIEKTFRMDEGLSRRKAVAYGNMFTCHLLLKHYRKAEAYFLQSNLNYCYAFDWSGLFRNLQILCLRGFQLGRSRPKSIPDPVDAYRSLCLACRFKRTEQAVLLPATFAVASATSLRDTQWPKARMRRVLIKLLTNFLELSAGLTPSDERVRASVYLLCLLSHRCRATLPKSRVGIFRGGFTRIEHQTLECCAEWLREPTETNLRRMALKRRIDERWQNEILETWRLTSGVAG